MADFNFSVFTQAQRLSADDSLLAGVLHRSLGAEGGSDDWEVTTDGFWCCLIPRRQLRRSQGWKLHLSATSASAETVLARSLPVLLEARSAVKFASTLEAVAQLNARNAPRGHSGKFITVYPYDDEEAVRLAEALHQTTAGLAGPRILSDRPYAPGSLVHYRYGGFVEERRLSNEGLYAWVIFDPDGHPVEDQRIGQYTPPAWASCPFPPAGGNGAGGNGRRDGRGVLLADRFLVREAIRHANKGGVYRAVDTHTGADAVIKEARPHVAADAAGRDLRDLLRAEARALEKVASLGVAPRLLLLFEQSQHLFLAEELVPGVSLRRWVPDQIRNSGWRRRVPQALDMAERLVGLMAVAHDAGLVLRDFNPNNLMVLPDGGLRLIDLELAVTAGEQEADLARGGTPGFGAPEQLRGAAPAVEADSYSLGATVCYVVTGDTPYFMEESPSPRPLRERLAEWLAVREQALDLPAAIRALILGLMDDEPERRWTTSAARRAFAMARTPQGRSPQGLSPGGRGLKHDGAAVEPDGAGLARDDAELGEQRWRQAVDGILGYLLTAMDPADDERLWPESCARGVPDPCAVQFGAAGVLGVLTDCFRLTGDQRLPEAIATVGDWIVRRLRGDERRPPGLYFGEAGIAWSLYEAGRGIGEDRLAEHALEVARRLPGSWSNPDMTHGTAGIGLTFLHLWLRTRAEEFAERAGESADALIASVSEHASGLIWATPAAFDSRLAGGRYHGFAHGTAGVGCFLLAFALAAGRADCLALARRAGETLLANATVEEDLALWGPGPGEDPTAPYWCHGSSGIGSFLIRLYRATGDDRFALAAQQSARAVMENAWRGVLGQCHGLAGNGEFLLDMAAGADGQHYEACAQRLARVLFASRVYRDGRVVFPDEYGNLSASWGDGVSGVLAFLLRLRHRSPRQWMLEEKRARSRQA